MLDEKLVALLVALNGLLDDIETMQSPSDRSEDWFGGFGEYATTAPDGKNWNGTAEIEWPNLRISADEVAEALHEYTEGLKNYDDMGILELGELAADLFGDD